MTIGHERVPLGGPAAWIGRDLERDGSWVWHLDGAALAAIDAALAAVRRAGLRWQDLTPERFPIGDFAETMAALGEALEHGRGIVVLRGLPVKDYDAEALQCIHYGLALHLGTPVYQSARGELIGAITDEGAAALERGTLAAKGGDTPFLSSRARVQTTGPLRFHTDRTDVVTLLCAEPAAAGGLSQIASAVTIHDTMLARRPDLLEQLFLDLPRSRLGEESRDGQAYYMLPVFALEAGHLTTHYSRTYVEAGQLVDHVPRVTPAQWEALDLLQELGYELCLTHRMQAGDIQYLNNHIMFHARTAYEDGSGAAGAGARDRQRRLLYRIWISMANSRPLPKGHAVLFGATEAGALRGGIRQPDGGAIPPQPSAA